VGALPLCTSLGLTQIMYPTQKIKVDRSTHKSTFHVSLLLNTGLVAAAHINFWFMYKMIRSIVLLLSCLFALVSVVSCQTSAREVDKARAEFYEALQEAVQELALLPEAEIESTFADLLESLGDDRKAVEFVQNIMDEVKLEAMVSLEVHRCAYNKVLKSI
jgi:hypothetical protein